MRNITHDTIMCDTLAILGSSTKKGNTLFGKNSDREADEVQNVIFYPRKTYPDYEQVKCTYISIPQVEETYDMILSQIFWIWGGEMGVNKFGVTIGNEAVYTNEPLNEKGLLGMDMLRLALERSTTAKEALEIIIDLLETYGQGGNCGYHRKLNYHNSWLITDRDQGFVLETAGEHWVWKEFKDNYGISNCLTIEDRFDEISDNAISNAIKKGRCNSEREFSFKKCYDAKGLAYIVPAVIRRFIQGENRRQQHYNTACQYVKKKSATVRSMMDILRSHNVNNFEPAKGTNKDVCWHEGSLLSVSQSVNSFITETSSDDLTSIWTTLGSGPCIQMYKPFFLSKSKPNSITDTGFGYKFYNKDSAWWQNEVLHRLVLRNYPERLAVYEKERSSYENQWIDEAAKVITENGDVFGLSQELYKKSVDLTNKWIENVKIVPEKTVKRGFTKHWDKLSKSNKMP